MTAYFYWDYKPSSDILYLRDHAQERIDQATLAFLIRRQNNKIILDIRYNRYNLTYILKNSKIVNSNYTCVFPANIYFVEDRIAFLKETISACLQDNNMYIVNKDQLNFI